MGAEPGAAQKDTRGPRLKNQPDQNPNLGWPPSKVYGSFLRLFSGAALSQARGSGWSANPLCSPPPSPEDDGRRCGSVMNQMHADKQHHELCSVRRWGLGE